MKKLFAAILILISTLLTIALGIIINGHYFKSDNDLKECSNNSWMNYINDDTLVNDIVMPGSHDAGTCSMIWLGRTQGYSVKNQLYMGARYFDLRVNKTEDGYYMYHEMFNGEKFEDVMTAISDFIKENKTETLVLDFQHFKGGSEDDVVTILDAALVSQGLAVQNDTEKSELEFVSELKLKDVRGKCIILFGDDENAKKYDFLFSRNDDECTESEQALNSCYISDYNKMKSEDFIDTAIPYYYQNIKDKIKNEGNKGLFVLQGQLTDGYLIFGPYSKEKKHDKNMTDYINGIKDDSERLSLTNIIMRDFLTVEKCENIISLNAAKGNVKPEFEVEFKTLFDS